MSENQCRTCAGIKKELHRFWKWNEMDHGMGRYQITATIDAEYRSDILKQEVYFHTIERHGSYRVKINFCPECGASIKRRLRKWRQESKQDTLKQP